MISYNIHTRLQQKKCKYVTCLISLYPKHPLTPLTLAFFHSNFRLYRLNNGYKYPAGLVPLRYSHGVLKSSARAKIRRKKRRYENCLPKIWGGGGGIDLKKTSVV